MSESIPKEIIGIAHTKDWANIREFVKALLKMTLDSNEPYSLIALHALINNEKQEEEYDIQIDTKDQIELLNSITNFEKISLYQYSNYKRNMISITKDRQVIVLSAQYMGPELDHTNYFDFAIYLNSLDLPYFSDNKGNVFDCQEIIHIISKFKPEVPRTQAKPKTKKKPTELSDLEISTFKKITKKNAIRGGKETDAFIKWKQKVNKDFQEKTGGLPYYRGKITKKFENFLNELNIKAIFQEIKLEGGESALEDKSPAAKKKPTAKKKPAPKTKTAAKKKPTAKKKPAPKTKTAAKKKPTAKKKPAPKTKTAAKKKPTAKKKPAPKTKTAAKKKPTAKKKPAPKTKTAAKKKPTAKKKPAPKAKTTAKKKPAPKAKTTAKKKPAPKTKTTTKKKPAPKTKTAAKKKPAPKTKTAAKKKPALKAKTTAKKKPAPKTKTAAKKKPTAKKKPAPKTKTAAKKKPTAKKKPAPKTKTTAKAKTTTKSSLK